MSRHTDPAMICQGVGEKFQDHLQIRTAFRIKGARTLNEWQSRWHGKAEIAPAMPSRDRVLWLWRCQLGILRDPDPRYETANIEFHVQPLSLDRFGEPLHSFPAITVSVW